MPSRFRACALRSFRLLGGVLVPWLLAGAAQAADLSVGFMPGPYRDAFSKGIEPQLKKLGYTVK